MKFRAILHVEYEYEVIPSNYRTPAKPQPTTEEMLQIDRDAYTEEPELMLEGDAQVFEVTVEEVKEETHNAN